MLWLIWIAMMLLVPIGAGVQIWFQIHRAQHAGEAVSGRDGEMPIRGDAPAGSPIVPRVIDEQPAP